jgi:5-formyltetrahydrofolate cyclo-ligase
MTQTDPTVEKATLRRTARAIRATQSPALGIQLAAQILAKLPIPAASTIAGIWPLPGEIDLRPLWHTLNDAGHVILLPQTPPPGQPLIFRHWHPAAAMLPERFGTLYPEGPPGTPTLIFVPLLAFDAAGHRLGYGGGYYDRTLAAHPGVPAIGIAYAAQRVAQIPTGPHDRALDMVFTELGLEVDRRQP